MKRLALVVGVGEFADPAIRALPLAPADAAALEELLGRLGYEVTLLCDGAREERWPTRPRVEAALSELFGKAAPEDLVLVYFACHGVREGDQGAVLALRDAARDRLGETGLLVAQVEERLKGCAAGKRVLLLDACHSGVDIGRDLPRVTDAEFLQQMERAEGFALLAASTAAQLAQEAAAEAGHGLFTYFVLQGLAGEAASEGGRVTVSDLVRYVSSNVSAYTAAHRIQMQQPTARIEGFGDIALSDRPAEPPRWPSPPGRPPDAYPPRRFSPWEEAEAPPPAADEELPLLAVAGLRAAAGPRLFAVRKLAGQALGRLYSRAWDDGDWGRWRDLGLPPVAAAPAIAARGDALELVTCEADGHLRHRTLRVGADGALSAGRPDDLGEAPGGPGAAAVVAFGPAGLQVFAQGKGGSLQVRERLTPPLDEAALQGPLDEAALQALQVEGAPDEATLRAELRAQLEQQGSSLSEAERERVLQEAMKKVSALMRGEHIEGDAPAPEPLGIAPAPAEVAPDEVPASSTAAAPGEAPAPAPTLAEALADAGGMMDALWSDWSGPWFETLAAGPEGGAPIRYAGPAALQPVGDEARLFALGTDGHLWLVPCHSLERSNWDQATDLGGADLGAPVPVSRGVNHLDLFSVGKDGRLQQRTFYLGLGWSAWVAHEGGPALASLCAVSSGAGSLELYALDREGRLHSKRFWG